MSLRATAYASTDRGAVRTQNEDTVAVFGWRTSVEHSSSAAITVSTAEPQLLVVADGLGGHVGGDRASGIAVAVLQRNAHLLVDSDAIESVLLDIDSELHDVMEREHGINGMGTTIAGLVVHRSTAIAFNVGDSRIYRLGPDGVLFRISTDDTRYPATGAATHVILQALGGIGGRARTFDCHARRLELRSGDTFLLCSDGLSDFVHDSDLERTLCKQDQAVGVVDQLVDLALSAGSDDNISAVVVTFVDAAGRDEAALPGTDRSPDASEADSCPVDSLRPRRSWRRFWRRRPRSVGTSSSTT